ncbi:pyocin knob domain-containing protein [Achromobacter piechaudii]|uniref:pyocin knob domain-containing protein n=1 Tax=Achromobacter piechaudii TaxID=72556 RepID=UPI003DA96FAC
MVNIQTINVGLAPNDKKGDPLRDAMQKVNLNFSALNIAIQVVLDGKGQINGYASLGADGRLLAAQAPIVYSAALPTTAHDLNNYVTPGTFYQSFTSGATSPTGLNYPVAVVGFLEVVATGTPVLQVYTTRVAGTASQRFWRTRMSSTTWSSWKELTDTLGVLAYIGSMATSQDLNNYTQRGIWTVASSAVATGGANYPIGQSGTLEVLSSGVPGGTAAASCTQVYYAANSGQTFTRSLASGTWTAWVRVLDSSQLGVGSGVGSLDAAGRQPITQIPAPVLLPPTSHDLDTYDQDGVFGQNATAGAVAGSNYPPEKVAGVLTVQRGGAGNILAHQWYRTYFGNNSTIYYRNKVSSGWGNWIRLAKYDESMTHTFLTVATDVNTLTTDNVYYTWVTTTPMTGANWPATSAPTAGFMRVYAGSTTTSMQEVTYLYADQKPRRFVRRGNPLGTWGAWRVDSAWSNNSGMPTADYGDIYVDGLGWHRWNGSAYELSSLAASLPSTAHDLNSYQTPGQYRQSSTAGAQAGTNYPVAIGGLLEVIGTGTAGQTKQLYTVASTGAVSASAGPRQFWRFAINTTWSPWQEALTAALGMTHVYLTAATDANTLVADNTYYTWQASAVAGGANFPGYTAAGYMQVFWQAATVVSQELTLLLTGGKPLKFARFGNTSTGVWQPWKVLTPFASSGWLPSSDMGDIEVDGQGKYRWNSALSSYVLAPPTPTHRQGLKTAWASASTITVYPGMCASAGGEAMLLLSNAVTRTCQTSGAFVHSDTGNALLTGARVANTWYYIFLLRRNSDGAVCVAFDTTFNCANRPSTHSYYRRIGQFITDSNADAWAYSQYGNQFWLNTSFDLWSSGALIANGAYSPATYTPPNVAHIVKLGGFISSTGSGALLQRFANAGGTSAYQYVLTAFSGANSVNWWEAPMAAVPNPTVSFLVGVSNITATVKVFGYIDLFED